MNRGTLQGLKRLFLPVWLGGGNPANDGLGLVADSIRESGIKLIGAPVSLADAANISTDASLGSIWGSVFSVTLGGNRIIDAPTNLVPGQRLIYKFKQDATGSRTLTWNSIFRFGIDVPSPLLTVTPSKSDYIGFLYSIDATMDCISIARGY